MKTRFYRVLESQKSRGINQYDILCTTASASGTRMLKLATPSRPTELTCLWNSEPEWENKEFLFEEISENKSLIDFVCTLKPLIPHMPSGKHFMTIDIKMEMKDRMSGY